MLLGGQQVRVVPFDRAAQPAEAPIGRDIDACFLQPGRGSEVEKVDQVGGRDAFGIEPQFVERQPERVPRNSRVGSERELGMEMIEASSAHPASSSVGMWSGFAGSVRAKPKRGLNGVLQARSARALLVGALLAAGCQEAQQPIDPARIAPIAARVEAIRGLSFRTEVPGRWLERAEVRAILAEDFDEAFPVEQAREGERLLRALGFWRHRESLRAALLDHDSEWLAGFYDPTPARILYAVRDPAFDPSFQEETLVHELAHALQDQHAPAFSLELGIDEEGDLLFGFAALREGAAQWVQYQDTLNREGWPIPSPEAARAEAEINLQDRTLPRLIAWGRVRVYSEGYVFVRRVLAVGGTAALNRALADPPLSSAEILHPGRYLERPRDVPFVPSEPGAWAEGCESLSGEVFGELGLSAWLADHEPQVDPSPLAAAWDGDRAWRLRCGEETHSVWLIQFDSNENAAAFLATARNLPAARSLPPGLEADGRGRRVVFHSGLQEAAREQLLESLEIARLTSFADYLAANPAVRERAAERIREASE